MQTLSAAASKLAGAEEVIGSRALVTGHGKPINFTGLLTLCFRQTAPLSTVGKRVKLLA